MSDPNTPLPDDENLTRSYPPANPVPNEAASSSGSGSDPAPGDVWETEARPAGGLPPLQPQQDNNRGKVGKEPTGLRIGPFRLRQRIGTGGMGEVWMADQSEPVKRQVALKLIKHGFGSKEVLARFEAERQALALMNHPNIARILDAGATPDGQPYFAMELVRGKPLTTYCDENKLSIDERLNLFIEVCNGVQHAHQKGIIHRDLKPSNILVSVIDGKAVPKVIDFGLAKAMESTQRLTDQSLFTGIGQILGTLKYMSPEQASLDSLDIDTRTDIYALGVILYELLTGSTPLDNSSITDQAALKVLEFIRDKEPVKPSSKLSSNTDAQISTITGRRKTDSFRLNRILAGDLDWIVMKALEKDRTRRYESASGFAADVQRYLKSEPVVARPPSLGYRLRKFVRKNRVPVVAAITCAVALLAGITGTTIFAIKSRQSQVLAEAAEAKALEALRLFTDEITMRVIGERSNYTEAEKAFFRLAEQQWTKFSEYAGDSDRAQSIRAEGLYRLGHARMALGRDSVETIQSFENAIKLFSQLQLDGRASFYDRRFLAASHQNLGFLQFSSPDKAFKNFRLSINQFQELLGEKPDDTQIPLYLATAYVNLSVIDTEAKDLKGAIEYFRSASSNSAGIRSSFAKCLLNYSLAEQTPRTTAHDLAVDAIALLERNCREEPSSTDYRLSLLLGYDCGANSTDDLRQKLEYREKAAQQTAELLRESESVAYFRDAAQVYFNLALELMRFGRYAEALPWLENAVDKLQSIARKDQGVKTTLLYRQSFWHLAEALMELDRRAEAIPHWDEAIVAAKVADNEGQQDLGFYFQVQRARCVAAEDSAQGVQELESISGLLDSDYENKPEVIYNAATVYVAAFANSETEQRPQFLKKVFECLTFLEKSGYLSDPQNVEYLQGDAEFEPVLETPEFRELLARVSKN